jgi:membrane protein DedA with SNARE-associated domain
MPNKQNKSGKTPDNDKRPKAVYKLTGMALKMGLIIYLGIFVGQQIDERSTWETPWFTLAGSLVGVALALYFVINDLKSI